VYEFKIVYKAGVSNKVVNALSRKFEDSNVGDLELRLLSRLFWYDVQHIDIEVRHDSIVKKICEELQANPNLLGQYIIEHDHLHYKGKLVLSASSNWVPKLLHEYHATPWRDI